MSTACGQNGKRSMKPIKKLILQVGFSDIRMWPCYMILCIVTLFFNKWLGLFWATVLTGMPAFIVSLRLFKLHEPDKAPVKEVEVYADIERIRREHELHNYLLRRNMKIIQEDENETKQLTEHAVAVSNLAKLG